MVYIRYCKRCGSAFDVDITKKLCPDCRRKKKEVEENE